LDRAPAGSGARHRGVLPPHRRGLRRGGRQRLAAQRPRDGPLLKAHPWRGEEHRQDPRSSSETMRFFLQNERVFSNVLYFFLDPTNNCFFCRPWMGVCRLACGLQQSCSQFQRFSEEPPGAGTDCRHTPSSPDSRPPCAAWYVDPPPK